jgi:hypothetical protein
VAPVANVTQCGPKVIRCGAKSLRWQAERVSTRSTILSSLYGTPGKSPRTHPSRCFGPTAIPSPGSEEISRAGDGKSPGLAKTHDGMTPIFPKMTPAPFSSSRRRHGRRQELLELGLQILHGAYQVKSRYGIKAASV